jgi:uncharacterized protein YyaL (SSP411 family)
MKAFTNRLEQETSPYLLQHAHNPVDWFPWGEEALNTAREQNKPILVSIGYAACHWCHVMEKESFEDEGTAAIMNEHFVNIKIDREERPDLDHIYMDAVQAMSGSGGWPLNVFLTPEGKPFYGGTYFPPKAVYNRPSWQDVLTSVAQAFREKRADIDAQAEQLTDYINRANSFGQQSIDGTDEQFAALFNKDITHTMFNNLMQVADKKEGGFGNAPKFPQTFSIQYLLHYYYHTGNEQALQQACLSLDKMIGGGIYDQVGGGFARYSTDAEWLVPHFEKMLYDNALLVIVLSEAYQATQKELYKRTIEQTLAFVERELYLPEGGFYSALDADSEGVEGKFYVWSRSAVEAVLGEEADAFCRFFDITAAGNWEHTNILNTPVQAEVFAAQNNIPVQEWLATVDACREKLLAQRSKRIRPLLDDKILLGWNALMNVAFCKAYGALGHRHYADLAIQNMEFLLTRFQSDDGAFYHTWKNKSAKYPAFLDDFAYVIQALVVLQEMTGDTAYLNKARLLTERVIQEFSEESTGFFFFTGNNQQDVIVRKKEVYDGAVPSGNAIMAINLYYLGIVFDVKEWLKRAVRICGALHQAISKHPTSFGVWATMIQALANHIPEIVITGKQAERARTDFLRIFIPFRVFQSSPLENEQFPLLAGKPYSNEVLIFLCKDYACQTPVNEVESLVRLMKSV